MQRIYSVRNFQNISNFKSGVFRIRNDQYENTRFMFKGKKIFTMKLI